MKLNHTIGGFGAAFNIKVELIYQCNDGKESQSEHDGSPEGVLVEALVDALVVAIEPGLPGWDNAEGGASHDGHDHRCEQHGFHDPD